MPSLDEHTEYIHMAASVQSLNILSDSTQLRKSANQNTTSTSPTNGRLPKSRSNKSLAQFSISPSSVSRSFDMEDGGQGARRMNSESPSMSAFSPCKLTYVMCLNRLGNRLKCYLRNWFCDCDESCSRSKLSHQLLQVYTIDLYSSKWALENNGFLKPCARRSLKLLYKTSNRALWKYSHNAILNQDSQKEPAKILYGIIDRACVGNPKSCALWDTP